MSEPRPLERVLVWLLPGIVAVLVAAFFLLMSWDGGPWGAQFRAAHPLALPLLAMTLILLAPVTVLIYHWVASKAASRRTRASER